MRIPRPITIGLVTIAALAAFGGSGGPREAGAAPVIQVRARTRVEIDRVFAATEGVAQVRGRLIDQLAGTGLTGLTVDLEIDGQEHLATTDGRGEFRASFEVGPGDHALRARFLGDEEYQASEIDYRFELGRETPLITIGQADEVEAGAPLVLTVVVTVAGEPAVLPLFVAIGPAGGALVEVARESTDVGGVAKLRVAPADLGPPGDKRVRVSFKGSEVLNPASAEQRLRIMSTTRLVEVVAPVGVVPYEGTMTLAGRLVDEGGRGIPGQTVIVRGGDERAAGVLTDREGGFTARLKSSRFAAGPLTLQLEYPSTTPWRRGSKTPPITITIAEPRPVPIGYTLGAFAITALGVVGFGLGRTRPWRHLIAKWQARRRAPGGNDPSAKAPDAAAGAKTGLVLGRPSLIATLKRPADHGLTGTVRDAITAAPLAGAEVALIHGTDPPHTLLTDDAGHFEIDGLAAASWQVVVHHLGYVAERFTLTVPHRGEFRDTRIDLLPVREAVFQHYRRTIWSLLPGPEVWGVWTPREILDHVRRRRPERALAALTDFVEECYFSARVPDEDAVFGAQTLAQAVRAEQGLAPGGDGPAASPRPVDPSAPSH